MKNQQTNYYDYIIIYPHFICNAFLISPMYIVYKNNPYTISIFIATFKLSAFTKNILC